jgi:molybdate/tungstate transport system substrate-binding protein
MEESMKGRGRLLAAACGAVLVMAGGHLPAQAAEPVTLTVFGAGTLAVPFKQVDALFQKKYPNVTVQPQFGGSVKMAKKITELHQQADLLAVADYNVIPKYLFGGNGKTTYATWYAGFARNAITFTYTDKSKGAGEINAKNWYEVLARPGVEIGRSNPDTDPSGYQTVQMLALAAKHYGVPDLESKILANAPLANQRDTETSLISALQLGQIDYLAIYRSDALQHHLKYIKMPAAIDLSDPALAGEYKKGVAHTRNGDLPGKPIVYAITIPSNAPHAEWAAKYVAFLLGSEGQAVMKRNGFGEFKPAYAVAPEKMPAVLRGLVKPWTAS